MINAQTEKQTIEQLKNTDLKPFLFQVERQVYDEWSSPNSFSRTYVFVAENHEKAYLAFLQDLLALLVEDKELLNVEKLKHFPYGYMDICSEEEVSTLLDFNSNYERSLKEQTELPKISDILNSVRISYSENNTADIPLLGVEISQSELDCLIKLNLIFDSNIKI